MKRITFTFFLVIFFSIIFICSYGQIISEANTGRPYRETKYNEVYGSAYLFDEWKYGSVILDNGLAIDNVQLKFDLVNNKFLYSQNDSVYEFISDVREVKLKNPNEKLENEQMLFEKAINANNKIPTGTFVQILSSGKITFLKYFLKKIEGENTTNGIFSTKKEIISHNSYWATIDDQIIPVKLNKHSLEELTSNKNDQIEDYIKSNKLNIKSESGFAAVINYYNIITLKKK